MPRSGQDRFELDIRGFKVRRPLHFTNKAYIGALCAIALQLAGCGDAENRAQSYYQHGKELLEQHDDQKAAIEFKNALKLKGDLLPAWRGLAQAEEASGHLDRLIPVLQTIIQLDPQDLPTKLKLARLTSSCWGRRPSLRAC